MFKSNCRPYQISSMFIILVCLLCFQFLNTIVSDNICGCYFVWHNRILFDACSKITYDFSMF